MSTCQKIGLKKSNEKQIGLDYQRSMIVGRECTSMISIVHADLVALRDNGQLIPGQFYRITDFVTTVDTTTNPDARSAGHQFDVIVRADSTTVLNENAYAAFHEGDTYFASCKLNAWKVWYAIDNDTDRFGWADAENGKGVIYRLIDEYNNDCPYDFKNVQFKYGLFEGGGITTDGDEDYHSFLYTFSWRNENNEIIDASIFGNDGTLLNDEAGTSGVYNNIIGPCYTQSDILLLTQTLNNNVFFSYIEDDGCFYGYFDNTLGVGCYGNIFGNSSYVNKLSEYCINNTFTGYCNNNTLREYSSNNIFNLNCVQIELSIGCGSNIFGNTCQNIKLDNTNYNNTFGDECMYIKLHDNCASNNFGHYCQSIIFGDNCYNNTLGNYCKKVTFNGNVTNTTVVGGENQTYYSQNLTVIGTVIGKTIDIRRGEEYETFAGMNGNGDFVIWSPVDNVQNALN